jgi:sugar lactone lactonase YvrE
MRSLSPLFLFLVALSASADCTSRVLLRASGPVYNVHVDNGLLFYSFVGERTILRVDEATGQSSTFFTADEVASVWDIQNGTIIFPSATGLLFIAPDGSRRVGGGFGERPVPETSGRLSLLDRREQRPAPRQR